MSPQGGSRRESSPTPDGTEHRRSTDRPQGSEYPVSEGGESNDEHGTYASSRGQHSLESVDGMVMGTGTGMGMPTSLPSGYPDTIHSDSEDESE
jgi:hypothetical protein